MNSHLTKFVWIEKRDRQKLNVRPIEDELSAHDIENSFLCLVFIVSYNYYLPIVIRN